MVQLHFLFDWAADMAKAKEPAEALKHLARAVPVGAGFAFSALVAAILLPVAAIQQRRLGDLADTANAEASAAGCPFRREEWLATSGVVDRSPLRITRQPGWGAAPARKRPRYPVPALEPCKTFPTRNLSPKRLQVLPMKL